MSRKVKKETVFYIITNGGGGGGGVKISLTVKEISHLILLHTENNKLSGAHCIVGYHIPHRDTQAFHK